MAILLAGVASYLVSMAQEGMTEKRAGKNSLHGHDSVVERVVYAADGRTLISCGWDKRVRFWNLAEDRAEWGREVDSLRHDWAVFAVALTADGKYLATGGLGGFTIWSRQTKEGTWELNNEQRGALCRCVAVSPDSHTLAVGGSDGTVRLWDIEARKQTRILDRLGDQLRTIDFSPSGAFLAASSFSGEFRVWDMRSPTQPHALACGPDSVQSFVFAPDDQTFAVAQSGTRVNSLGLWDLRTCKPRLPLSVNRPGNYTLAYSADGRVMASADKDSTIRFWDTTTGKLEGSLQDGVSWVKTMAFSADGRQLAFAGGDGIIHFRPLLPPGRPPTQTNSS